MKLFKAKCNEWATLQKLWGQTGNSSLLPVKCWTLLHMIRECSWRWPDDVDGIWVRFSKFAFVLFCYITNNLMPGPLGDSEFCFPQISIGFPRLHPGETLRFPSTSHKLFNIDAYIFSSDCSRTLYAPCLIDRWMSKQRLTMASSMSSHTIPNSELESWIKNKKKTTTKKTNKEQLFQIDFRGMYDCRDAHFTLKQFNVDFT